jgi:uncharacterized membrane protein
MTTSYPRIAGQSLDRLAALSDGIFAVAMTLLVLDIKVPELQQPLATAELPLKLVALWPKFLSYTSASYHK